MGRYEAPELIDLNESAIGLGANSCAGGSNPVWGCLAGNRAGTGCEVGNTAVSYCQTGGSGGTKPGT